jgi:tripartite-type tricarboxylate transporter receptor subunit TctC
MIRTFLRLLLASSAVLPLCSTLAAEPFPNRPVRLIVPFPAGRATDSIVRLVAQKLSEKWQQQVIVDNRPGAGTIIATDIAAKAPADGYTLLVVTVAFAVNPALYKKLPYDTEKDFTPVTLLSSAPNVLVVNPSVPAATAAEFVRYARAHPKAVNFGSAGNGTSNHLAGEMLRTMTGADIVHVPYKGDAPAITDLIGGQIQMLFIGWAPVSQHVKAGRLRALAVTSAAPSDLVPGLPSLSDAVPGFESSVWNGIVVPARTPPELVAKLHADISEILSQPDLKEKIQSMGFEPVGNAPGQFRDFLHAENKRLSKVVLDADVTVD